MTDVRIGINVNKDKRITSEVLSDNVHDWNLGA